MKKLVEVTQEHIDSGMARTCHVCPVALAIKGAVKQGVNVAVLDTGGHSGLMGYEASFASDDGLHYIDLPENVSAFIRTFDDPTQPHGNGRSLVAPFSFELDFPDGVLK